jgi:hypothetical protein
LFCRKALLPFGALVLWCFGGEVVVTVTGCEPGGLSSRSWSLIFASVNPWPGPYSGGALVLWCFGAIGAIGALINRVRQPRTLVVLGLNAEMGTAAGADELVEIPAQKILTRTKAHPLHLSTSLEQKKELSRARQAVRTTHPLSTPHNIPRATPWERKTRGTPQLSPR